MLAGVFITALYSFRMFFIVFHGKERMDNHTREHLKESPAVVWVPLVLLAIPSLVIGFMTAGSILFGDYFSSAIVVHENHHEFLNHIIEEYKTPTGFLLHGMTDFTMWIGLAGIVTAWFLYIRRPDLAGTIKERLGVVYNILIRKYGFDELYQALFAGGSRRIGKLFWKNGDVAAIDGIMVNGTANMIGWISGKLRYMQSGYLYHYAFTMIIGLIGLLTFFVLF